MTSLAIVVCFGFMLSEANRELGLFDILINGIGSTVPAFLVPPLAFLLVGLTVFAVGGCWVVMTIAIPVFMTTAGTGVSNITVQFSLRPKGQANMSLYLFLSVEGEDQVEGSPLSDSEGERKGPDSGRLRRYRPYARSRDDLRRRDVNPL